MPELAKVARAGLNPETPENRTLVLISKFWALYEFNTRPEF